MPIGNLIFRPVYSIFSVQNLASFLKRFAQREKWEKKNIRFLGDELLSFTPVVTLHFEPDLSVGPETDHVTFLNIPAVVSCLSYISFNQHLHLVDF